MSIEFQGWPKTPRLNRPITITEKIDGTNAAIIIEEGFEVPREVLDKLQIIDQIADGQGGAIRIAAQSRKRLVVPGDDNFGFGLWVATHAEDLIRALGPGRHFGEWWGHGIQRGYGLAKGQRAFSLFNTHRYEGVNVAFDDNTALTTVPVLWQGQFHSDFVEQTLEALVIDGSSAAPGFMKPEGVIVYHSASNSVFKVLAENDDQPKGEG